MSQNYQAIKTIIYYDVTAGRGSYDDDFPESEIDLNRMIYSKDNEIKNDNESIFYQKSNENHCTFANKKDIKSPNLFNQIQHHRRHSYTNRSSRGRANVRNDSQQSPNNTSFENNDHHGNENDGNEYKTKISSSQSHSPDTIKTLNWAPVPNRS